MGLKWLVCALGLMLAAFAAPAPAATLSGTVYDPTGAVAAQARVWLWQEQGVQATTTAADGTYAFKGVFVGPAQLVALKAPFALGGSTNFVVGDADVPLDLPEAGTIRLKVHAPPGQTPLPGARVFSVLVNGQFIVPVEDLLPHGFPPWRSDDAGMLDLPVMPRDGFAKVNLKHLDFADTFLDFLPVRERETSVSMEPGVRVQGRVLHGAKAVAGARVSIFQVGTAGQREFARTQSDTEGYYSARLLPGDYFVAARHLDFASPAPVGIKVLPKEEYTVPEVMLLQPYFLRGTVTLPDGGPCAGVRVTYRERDTIFDDTFTGSDGSFIIKAASPKGLLRVAPPMGFKTEVLSDIKVDLGDKREVTLAPVKLRKLPAIEGVVRMEDGTPAARVLLATLNVPQALWLITDDEGRFFFQLGRDPDVPTVEFLAEHAERFQRAIFQVSLDNPKPAEVTLKSYTPEEEQPTIPPGTNNLGDVLDTKAPALACSAWFNGDATTIDDFKGKATVMLFWAGFDTTIEGVNKVEQHRALEALYQGDPQVGFLALHDSTSEAAEVAEFVKRSGLQCPVGLDAEPMKTFGAFHVNFIPEVVLMDKSGNLRYYQPGPRIVEFIKILRRRAN